MLDKILKLFKIHFSAQAQLQDGTELYIEGDLISVGAKCFVVTPDGNMPLPDGDYPLMEGNVILSVKDGIIVNIIEQEPDDTNTQEVQQARHENPIKNEKPQLPIIEETVVKEETKIEEPQEVQDEILQEPDEDPYKKIESKIGEIETELKRMFDLIESNTKETNETVKNMKKDLTEITEKITLVKEVKRNVIEAGTDKMSRLQLISEMRNKK